MKILRKFFTIEQEYAQFKRYLQILDHLVLFGFGDLTQQLRPKFFPYFRNRAHPFEKKSRPERLRLLLESLGPTYIKLGQILSTRPDLIPPEYLQELSKLQESATAFPYSQVRSIIQKELKASPEECFRSFSPEPFAAASIGQVHHAVTFHGERVVVKVQRPNIARQLKLDLVIMAKLADRLENNFPELTPLRPQMIVAEFSHILHLELDYQTEAAHARRFRQEMAHQPGIYVPEIYDDLSGHQVLTMEFIDGPTASAAALHPETYNGKLLAHNGVAALLEQIFTHGFFHADPHPGNLLVRKHDELVFIDFGMMGRISESERYTFGNLITQMLLRNYSALAHAVLALTLPGAKPNMLQLERDLAELIEDNLYLPLKQISLARILQELMQLMNRHHLALQPDLYILIKSLITLETLGKQLDPDLVLLDALRPFLRRNQHRKYSPIHYLRKFAEHFEEIANSTIELPGTVNQLLHRAAEGEFTLVIQHENLENAEQVITAFSRRLSLAIVLAALIVGSSVMVLAQIPPFFFGIPMIGLLGFTLSALLGFLMLFRHVQRHLR